MFPRFGHFIALLLLALWLPVTQHCGLEAAGLLAAGNECHDAAACTEPHDQNSCDTDNCQTVEDSLYKPSCSALDLAPALTVLTCLSCLHDVTSKTTVVRLISPARSDVPLELVPSWQFTWRAAPAPRAPADLA